MNVVDDLGAGQAGDAGGAHRDAAPRARRAPSALRVAVVGAGAVGAVLGGRLARAGADVTFLARGATLAALRAHGLVLETPDGALHLPPGHAAGTAAEIGPVDVVLVAVKAEQVPAVATTLAPLLGAATVVVPLQNGVEASGQLAAALGEAHVAEGFCRMLAEQTAPGQVRHGGPTPSVAFGPRAVRAIGAAAGPEATVAGRDGLASGPRSTLERLARAFREAGVAVETPADVHAALWEKFLFVEPLGVVGAAARASFRELLATRETRLVLETCGREVLAVGRACGAALDDGALGRVWERYEALPGDGTTSLQRDLVAGRPSELDAQTGALVRLGHAHAVPTPAHDALYGALRPQELRARSVARVARATP